MYGNNGMDVIIMVLMAAAVVTLLFFGFIVYYIFKQIEFVLSATNLYKKIVTREDVIIKLLIDIRDNTKLANINEIVKLESREEFDQGSTYCPICKESDAYIDANGDLFCPNCRKIISN